MRESCWSCLGNGNHGSACIDDMCHGGDVPCLHGDTKELKCEECGGKGWIDDGDDDDFADEMDDAANELSALYIMRQLESEKGVPA